MVSQGCFAACAALVFSGVFLPARGDNWAVIVDASRYFYNYRHAINALAIYDVVRSQGVPDSNILLYLADYPASDPRNVFPGRLFFDPGTSGRSIAGPDVEVDVRGHGVNAASFIRLLTGQGHADHPRNQVLKSNNESFVLVYLTGHGGDEFLKFSDIDELGAPELGDAFQTMHSKGRYRELLLMVDTCQASTMASHVRAPNIISMASSQRGENSYALHGDDDIGVSTVDRFTAAALNFFSKHRDTDQTLADLFNSFRPSQLHSNPELVQFNSSRRLSSIPASDFFASVSARAVASRAVAKFDVATSDDAEERRPVYQLQGFEPSIIRGQRATTMLGTKKALSVEGMMLGMVSATAAIASTLAVLLIPS